VTECFDSSNLKNFNFLFLCSLSRIVSCLFLCLTYAASQALLFSLIHNCCYTWDD